MCSIFYFFNIYQRHICSTDQKNTWLGLVDDIYINVNFSYKIINETQLFVLWHDLTFLEFLKKQGKLHLGSFYFMISTSIGQFTIYNLLICFPSYYTNKGHDFSVDGKAQKPRIYRFINPNPKVQISSTHNTK